MEGVSKGDVMKLSRTIVCTLVLAACGNKQAAPTQSTQSEAAAPTAAPAPVAVADPHPAPAARPLDSEEEEERRLTAEEDRREAADEADGEPNRILVAAADNLEATWLEAQNNGDFASYIALYSRDFSGVRRTADGREQALDLAGWKADRKKMFRGKTEVVIEQENGETVGDDGTFVITFLQRWRSGAYADHGQKVITIVEQDGDARILREELLWSRRGWESSADDPDVEKTATASAVTAAVAYDSDHPLDDAECRVLVEELAGCGTGASATKDFKLWLIQSIFNGFDDPSFDRELATELKSWEQHPERVCKQWRRDAGGDPFLFPAPIRAAMASKDCAALSAAIGDGIPRPADD
jgi:hypothetical protein